VAAPIFQRIAEAAVRHYGVPRSINQPPPLLVQRDLPGAPRNASGPAEPPSVLPVAGGETGGEALVPDLTGMNGRDALRTLAAIGLPAQLYGHGTVTEQRPLPGTPVLSVLSARLWLDRRSPDAAVKALRP
jgi:hypothetical protein